MGTGKIRIVRLSAEPAVRLAALELRRYLEAMGAGPATVSARRRFRPQPGTLWLGTPPALPVHPLTADPEHDAIDVRVDAEGGFVAGANPRSVLIGVYRLLEALGCRWLRPGADGEVIPQGAGGLRPIRLAERASYRHRGICIEGAVSWENVRDIVDWLPKAGFNAYFIQFRAAFNFFQRWYEHTGNPSLPHGRFTDQRAERLTRRLRAQVSRRGLDLHMVGHGWTCEPFGIAGQGWYPHQGPVPATARPFLAQVNGKRELWGGVALNTNLCYGNPAARRTMVEAIRDYAQANLDVDLLHLWLADGANNHCECPRCAAQRPADLYVRLLNEADAALSAAGISTRLVFLIYVDLLWPPERERLAHPERFVLMFAPITRSYSTPFAVDPATGPGKLAPYRRNRLEFPRDPAANIAFLRAWQEVFAGDGFDFDYHLMWDHYKDPGQMAVARVLHRDVQQLQALGLNGLMSCQVQRAFFPTSLPMVAMGRTLWDSQLPLERIAAEHLRAAYGTEAPRVAAFLERMTQLFDPPLLRGERGAAELGTAGAQLERVAEEVAALRPIARRRAADEGCPAVRRSWQYLELFLELCLRLAAALTARHAEAADAPARAQALFEWVRSVEPQVQPVLDVFEFQQVWGPLLGVQPR